MTHDEYQMRKYRRMINKFLDGYYDKIYYHNTTKLLIFHRPNGKKNCLNIDGLYNEEEINRYKNFFIYS